MENAKELTELSDILGGAMAAMQSRPNVQLPQDAPETPDPAKEAERVARRRERHLLEARYPNRHRWALTDPAICATLGCDASLLQKATVAQKSNYAFTGPSGAGKTTIACLLLSELIAERGGGAFISAYELERERRGTPLGEGDGPLLSKALNSRVLLLDDVGAEHNGTFSPVVDVLFYRYDREMITIITTGLDKEAILARYGAGACRRMFERAFACRLGGKP